MYNRVLELLQQYCHCSWLVTGMSYDCQDILNLALMRPVFSPTDFVQIKGRGTRKYTFEYEDEYGKIHKKEKTRFKFFDFFANCEYFEEKYNYDAKLKLPSLSGKSGGEGEPVNMDKIEIFDPDQVKMITQKPIGLEGMKIDRKLFEKAKDKISQDEEIKLAIEREQWERAIDILRKKYENKPELFLTLEKIRKSENLDRRLTWREVLERIFGFIDRFKTKDEKLEEECAKFISIYKPQSKDVPYIKNFLKAYVSDEDFRKIIDEKNFAELNFYPGFSIDELKTLGKWRDIITEYVKDYIIFNLYAA
jgi:type I restriction enzyme R subunit